MTLAGAGFTPQTTVSLRGQGGPDIVGQMAFVNRNYLLVTFDLTGAALGQDNLVADAGGESDTVIDALEVVEGVGGQLTTELVLLSTSRSNTPFQARVVFENIGDANVPATIMRIQAPSDGTIWSEFQSSGDASDSLQFLTVPAEAVMDPRAELNPATRTVTWR